jgi:hypothetical protein
MADGGKTLKKLIGEDRRVASGLCQLRRDGAAAGGEPVPALIAAPAGQDPHPAHEEQEQRPPHHTVFGVAGAEVAARAVDDASLVLRHKSIVT